MKIDLAKVTPSAASAMAEELAATAATAWPS